MLYHTDIDFGLKTADGNGAIPLQGVSVRMDVIDFLAEVHLEQTYKNTHSEAIEAVYKFPLDPQSVIQAFEVHIDGRVIKGEVQEKQEAQDTYSDAIASGHGAVLVEQHDSMRDVFTCRVGNLPPNATAVVHLTYVMQIDEEQHEDGSAGLRISLPVALAPRYEPAGTDTGLAQHGHAVGMDVSFPDDLLKVQGSITTATRILELEPLTYKGVASTDIAAGQEGKTATFALTAPSLKEDFVLSVKLADRLQDRAWIQGDAIAVSVGLKPETLDSCKNESLCEYIFVVDRSGSMGGSRIRAASQALSLCVTALPVGAMFNIVGFGSSFQLLFPESVAFDEATKAAALAHCAGLDADLGGTEILPPLRSLALKKPSPDKPRQVLIITDGEVGNTDEVIEFVKREHRASATRYFTFGIGSGASRDLVKGIADVGQGFAEFITDGERMQGKIMQQMDRALRPLLTKVQVDFAPLRLLADASPKLAKPLYPGSRLLFFALVDPTSIPEGDLTVTAKGQSPDGEVAIVVPLLRAAGPASSAMVKTLAARSILKDMEDVIEALPPKEAEAKRAEAVALSKSSGVACRFTSLVAVDHRTDAVQGSMKPVYVPLSIEKVSQRQQQEGAILRAMCLTSASLQPCASTFAALGGFVNKSAAVGRRAKGGFGGGGMLGGFRSMFAGTSAPNGPTANMPPPPPCPAPCMSSPMALGGASALARGASDGCCDDEAERDMLMEGASSMRKREAKAPGAADHIQLVSRQKATGEWSLDAELAGMLGLDLTQLEAAGPGLDKAVWGTALVLARLRAKFAAFSVEWSAAARKARRWLEKGMDAAAADALINQAEAALASA